MKKTLLFSAVFMQVFFAACKDNNSIYEGCCGTEATTDTVHISTKMWNEQNMLVDTMVVGSFYIPNIFIPDSNINNYENNAFLMCGRHVVEIVSIRFTTESGELLFENSDVQHCDTGHFWFGYKPNGEYYYGLFNYEVKVLFIDGQIRTYIGKACAYKCSDKNFPLNNLPNCLFPSQHDGAGGGDPNLPIPDYCF